MVLGGGFDHAKVLVVVITARTQASDVNDLETRLAELEKAAATVGLQHAATVTARRA